MDKNNKSLFTLLMGAAIGAAGMYLSKKENRDKVKGKIDELKSESKTKVDELKQKGSEGLEKLQDKLVAGEDMAQREIDEAQEKIDR